VFGANRLIEKMDKVYIEGERGGQSGQFYYVRREPLPIISVHAHYPGGVAGTPSFLAFCAEAHLIFCPYLTAFEPIERLDIAQAHPIISGRQ